MKISLDAYISFVDSGNKSDYRADFINQIIKSQGFRKIYKTTKKVLVETVESIEMKNPFHLTLRQDIHAGSLISNDEANADVKVLDWFECSNCYVSSVQCMNVKSEAPASTDLIFYEGEGAPIQSKQKSAGKLPAMILSPAKKNKRTRGRSLDLQYVYFD